MKADEQINCLYKILLTIDMNRVYVERAIESVDEKKLTVKGLEKLNTIRRDLKK
jgi:hypothetical protein